jgi:hypothetical protein
VDRFRKRRPTPGTTRPRLSTGLYLEAAKLLIADGNAKKEDFAFDIDAHDAEREAVL